MRLLRSSEESVRHDAARQLGQRAQSHHDEEVALAAALQEEGSATVRMAVIDALARVGQTIKQAAISQVQWHESVRLRDEQSGRSPSYRGPALATKPPPPSDHYLDAIRDHIIPALTRSLYASSDDERDSAIAALRLIGTPESLQAIEESLAAPVNVVQFTAYYPTEARPALKSMLAVYAHLQMELADVTRDSHRVLDQSPDVKARRTSKQKAALANGTLVTFAPECADIEFDPVSVTKKWNGSWVGSTFRFQPSQKLAGDPVIVDIVVHISGVEVARVKCPLEIVERHRTETNPLAAARAST